MFEPQNEQGVIVRFSQEASMHGWSIVEISATFPDAILEKDGVKWRTEFEYEASSFLTHRHDHRDADLIVCWLNDYTDCPLPIIELSDSEWHVSAPAMVTREVKEIEYWKQRCFRAERQLSKATGPARKNGKSNRLWPDERRAEIIALGIDTSAAIMSKYHVSLRTAQADLSATRDAMMQTNGVGHERV